jgi:hypothetical protein
MTAIQIAIRSYQTWKGKRLIGLVWFIKDVVNYLNRGYVVARPTCFGLAHVTYKDGEPVWFIRIDTGILSELLEALPFFLPKITFFRRNKGKMKVYSLMELARLAVRLNKRRT